MIDKCETIDFGKYTTPINLTPPMGAHPMVTELREALQEAITIPAHWLPTDVIRNLKHGRKNRGSYSLAAINAYCERLPKSPPVDVDKLTTTANVLAYAQSTDDDGNILSEIAYDVDEYRLKCSQLAFGKLLASWAGKSLADYIEE